MLLDLWWEKFESVVGVEGVEVLVLDFGEAYGVEGVWMGKRCVEGWKGFIYGGMGIGSGRPGMRIAVGGVVVMRRNKGEGRKVKGIFKRVVRAGDGGEEGVDVMDKDIVWI